MQPIQRCLNSGPRTLSLKECLSILVDSHPDAEALLNFQGDGLPESEREQAFFNRVDSVLDGALGHDWTLRPGESPTVGQARLLAAFEVSRRYFQFRMRYERIHSKPEDLTRRSLSHTHSERAIAAVPEHLRIQSREWLGFVPVYQDGRPGEFCLVESGVRTHVNTDPVELFSRILALRPGALYLMHNHPSGILIPSESDRQLTEQVEKICAGFSIRLLGHAIVTARSHLWIML